MADKIRVGIVGATVTQGGSGWGANAHVPALKALPNYELKAVCTSHEDTAKASAAAFGAERAFHRFSDMAAHPEVDRKSTRLNSSHLVISYAVFCLKKKK